MVETNKVVKVRKMFPGGNSTNGFHSFFDYMIDPEEANRIFIIKGGPGVGKSFFMKGIAGEMVSRGFDIEEHHCSSDPGSLDGLVIPSLGVALLDGTSPHIVDPKNPGVIDEIINFGEYWDSDKIAQYRYEIIRINKRVKKIFSISYNLLKQARYPYDEWQDYISESVDKSKYNRIAEILEENIFENKIANFKTAPKFRHLFASAVTPEGVLDYKNSLINKGMKVYTIQGQPGTGVKQLIKHIADKAERLGLYTEQFHCPIEPEKLDMLIIPAINAILINVTGPYHTNIKGMEGLQLIDEIDLDICIRKEIIEQYKLEIDKAKRRFEDLLEDAIGHLKDAKGAHDEIEGYYIDAMNFQQVNEKKQEIVDTILQIGNK